MNMLQLYLLHYPPPPQFEDHQPDVKLYQDDASLHWTRIVSEFTGMHFPGFWAVCGEQIPCPTRSPNISPSDFFSRVNTLRTLFISFFRGERNLRIVAEIQTIIPEALENTWVGNLIRLWAYFMPRMASKLKLFSILQ